MGRNWSLWGTMGPYRVLSVTLWVPMGRYGALWGDADVAEVHAVLRYGALWVPMGPYGALWGSVGLYGTLWVSMGLYGTLWIPMGLYV